MLTPHDRDIVTRTLIGEAIGEGANGMRAVAHVIANRVNAGFGATPADVSLAKSQFSAWNKGKGGNKLVYAYGPNSAEYKKAAAITDQVFAGSDPDPTNGATYYVNPKGTRWTPPGKKSATIGQHVFYSTGSVPPLNVGQTAQGKQMPLGTGRGQIHSGPAVSQLQQQLAAKGYDPGPIDGKYGPKTANAVRNFETDNHLNVDKGVAGPQVLGALNAPPAYAPGGSVPPQGFPTAWGPQPPQMGPESAGGGTDPLYGRKVPTSTIGPPTIPGSPPPMGPGLPTYDPGNNALESAMGPSGLTAMGAPPPMGPGMSPAPAIEPLSAGLQQAIDRGSYRDQRGFRAPPIDTFTAGGYPYQTPIGRSPASDQAGISELATGTARTSPKSFIGNSFPEKNAPADVPVAAEHYPLTGDESISSVWEHVKDIPGAWGRLLGFGPDQSPAGPVGTQVPYASSPLYAQQPYTEQPSTRREMQKQLQSLAPDAGGEVPMFNGQPITDPTLSGIQHFSMPGALPLTSADPSRQAAIEASAAQPAPLSQEEMARRNYGWEPSAEYNNNMDWIARLNNLNLGGRAGFMGRRESDMIEDRRPRDADGNLLPPTMTPFSQRKYAQPDGSIVVFHPTSKYMPGDEPPAQMVPSGLPAPHHPWDAPDIMGGMLPPMGISGGGMMNHAGGLVDMPEAFGGPGNFRPVAYASAGSANDPRAPAVSGDYPLGRRGDLISPPSANPIDMFGADPAGASEVPMFAGKPITDTTLSGIQHFGMPSIAPAGGAPSWDNSAIYGGPDYGGTQPGYGLSAPFMAAPAPDLTVRPAAEKTAAAVQAIQQATQGGGSSGGAGRGGSPISPTSYGGSPGSYSYMGSTPWGGSIYQTPSGGPSYSPYTPSGWNAPNFTPGSGGSLNSWDPVTRTYLTSDGRTLSMD